MILGKVQKHGATQQVEIPVHAEFPSQVTDVTVKINGAERVLSPNTKSWDSFFLQGPAVSDDFMAESRFPTKSQ